MTTLPSVEAIIMVFPEEEGPNSFDRSTLIVRIFPSTDISTFFINYLLIERSSFPMARMNDRSKTVGYRKKKE
jgi:hypothetical protein